MKCNRIKFDGINPFDFSVNYIEIDSKAPENQNEHHVHYESHFRLAVTCGSWRKRRYNAALRVLENIYF